MTNPVSAQSTRRFACRFCRHDVEEHNVIVGCPYCTCAGTPGECRPRSDAQLDYPVISPTQMYGRYAPYRQREPEPEPAVPMSVADAVAEADAWLNTHRVNDTWRTMNRLRDTLVRQAGTEPEVEWAVIRRFPDADGGEHIIVDYPADDREDAYRVRDLLRQRNGHPLRDETEAPTRWRVASRPKVTWTDDGEQ